MKVKFCMKHFNGKFKVPRGVKWGWILLMMKPKTWKTLDVSTKWQFLIAGKLRRWRWQYRIFRPDRKRIPMEQVPQLKHLSTRKFFFFLHINNLCASCKVLNNHISSCYLDNTYLIILILYFCARKNMLKQYESATNIQASK